MNRISFAGQIRVYVGKCFRLFINEKQWISFISTLIIMFIISAVTSEDMFTDYIQTKNGCFAVVCACLWVGLFNSIQSICQERAIIKREYRTGLRISSYVLAHVIYEFFLCAVEAVIITVVVMVKNHDHLPDAGLLFPLALDIYISFLLITFSSDLLALMVSCIVKDRNMAMTVMPFVLIIQLVMAGVIFTLEGATEKVAYLTVSKWGYEVLMAISNTTDSVKFMYDQLNGTGSEPELKTLLCAWGMMLLFVVVYTLLSMLMLRRVDKDKR